MTTFLFVLLALADDPSLPAGLDVAAINGLARSVLLDSLPEKIEEKRDWGKQTNITTWKFTGQGMKTRLERLEKPVNHGTWKHYRIEPVEPKTRLGLSIESLKGLPDGGFSFVLKVSAPITASATVHQWAWGVRVLAVTVDADASATASLHCEVRVKIAQGSLLPVFTLSPKVVSSYVELDEFKIRKLGELPRPVAKELSDEAKRIVLHYIRQNEAKFAAKANAALEKKSKAGKLTFTPFGLPR